MTNLPYKYPLSILHKMVGPLYITHLFDTLHDLIIHFGDYDSAEP